MEYLPPALTALANAPECAAVISDFDGTLAPIVDDPTTAVVEPQVPDALELIAARYAVAAVVSGRSAHDVAARIGVPGVVYVGVYGLETLLDGAYAVDARAEQFAPAVTAAAEAAERELPGLWVERKGQVSVAVHWRRYPDRADEALEVARELAALHGLALVSGRRVAELMVPVPVDKGTAVESIIATVQHASFAGDDHGDLAAMRALTRARGNGQLDTTTTIAVRSAEEPPELADEADLHLGSPREYAALLRALADWST
ncbi:MAG: trehalose-phosphatase [Acidimicrobiia bacterium]